MFCCDVSFVCTVRSRNGKLSPYGYIMCRENRSPATYCLAWCGVNFWLRGPRLTASCHWNVPECGTSGSSVEYANVLGGGWFGSFLVVWFFFFSLCCGPVSVAKKKNPSVL